MAALSRAAAPATLTEKRAMKKEEEDNTDFRVTIWQLYLFIFMNNSHKSFCCSECPISVRPAERLDCGESGVSRQECENQGCCWDSSIRNTIWCFQKAGKQMFAKKIGL